MVGHLGMNLGNGDRPVWQLGRMPQQEGLILVVPEKRQDLLVEQILRVLLLCAVRVPKGR